MVNERLDEKDSVRIYTKRQKHIQLLLTDNIFSACFSGQYETEDPTVGPLEQMEQNK